MPLQAGVAAVGLVADGALGLTLASLADSDLIVLDPDAVGLEQVLIQSSFKLENFAAKLTR